MKKIIIMIMIFALLIGCATPKTPVTGNIISEDTTQKDTTTEDPVADNPVVTITTSMGKIEVELYPKESPETVKNFLKYVDEDFYDGTIFHRVISGFMIQAGGFTPGGAQKQTLPPIKLESNNGLSNDVGTIAMARTQIEDSATSQFFINTETNTFLNYASGNPGYAVFGKVTSGMDVVKKIEAVETSNSKGRADWPTTTILIESVTLN